MFIVNKVITPFKEEVNEIWTNTKDFFRDEIISPLKDTMSPYLQELKFQFQMLKDWSVDYAKQLGNSVLNVFDKANELSGKLFGERLGDVLEKKILEPIKDMWREFKKWFGNTITTMTRGVVGYIKDTSDNLAVKHIKAGKGGYISNSKFKKLQESGKLDGLTDEEIENYRSGRANYLSSKKDKRKADKIKLEEYRAKKAAKKVAKKAAPKKKSAPKKKASKPEVAMEAKAETVVATVVETSKEDDEPQGELFTPDNNSIF